LPKAYSVAQFDTAANIFECRLAPNIGGYRADHARDPAAGFGQVGDFGLDHNCNAFGQAQRGAVDDTCRVDAHVSAEAILRFWTLIACLCCFLDEQRSAQQHLAT